MLLPCQIAINRIKKQNAIEKYKKKQINKRERKAKRKHVQK